MTVRLAARLRADTALCIGLGAACADAMSQVSTRFTVGGALKPPATCNCASLSATRGRRSWTRR